MTWILRHFAKRGSCRHFEHDNPEVVGSVSRAERPLLDALYCVRNQLQNSGLLPPPRTPGV